MPCHYLDHHIWAECAHADPFETHCMLQNPYNRQCLYTCLMALPQIHVHDTYM